MKYFGCLLILAGLLSACGSRHTTHRDPTMRGTVVGTNVNVRYGPSKTSPKHARQAQSGEVILILGFDGDWVHVRRSDRTEGYIYRSYVSGRDAVAPRPRSEPTPRHARRPATQAQARSKPDCRVSGKAGGRTFSFDGWTIIERSDAGTARHVDGTVRRLWWSDNSDDTQWTDGQVVSIVGTLVSFWVQDTYNDGMQAVSQYMTIDLKTGKPVVLGQHVAEYAFSVAIASTSWHERCDPTKGADCAQALAQIGHHFAFNSVDWAAERAVVRIASRHTVGVNNGTMEGGDIQVPIPLLLREALEKAGECKFLGRHLGIVGIWVNPDY